MQHSSSQDILNIILSIIGILLASILGLLGVIWHHFNGQFKEMRSEMKDEINGVRAEMKEAINGVKDEINALKADMKEMAIRSTNKIDDAHQSFNKQISSDRERISHIEGYLDLPPRTPSQAAIIERKKHSIPVKMKVASA